MKVFFTAALTAFAMLSPLAVTSATAKGPTVMCIPVEFTAPKGSGRGTYFYYETVGKDPPLSAIVEKQVTSCMAKRERTGRGFIAFFPYPTPGAPWSWRVEAAACLFDRSAYVYKGILSPKKRARIIMKDVVAPGNKYCK